MLPLKVSAKLGCQIIKYNRRGWLDLPVLLDLEFTNTINSGWSLSPLRLSLVTLTIIFILVRLFTWLRTAPSFSFDPCRRYMGLHLNIDIDTLKQAKDVVHVSQRKVHQHFNFFFLIIHQCFFEEDGLASGSPSTYNYWLVASQSAHIADLPSPHVKGIPKQRLREIIPLSKELIFVHRSGYYVLWAALNRYEIIPGAGLRVFVQDRNHPAFPLRYAAQLKINKGLPPSLSFEVHPRTLGPIYSTASPRVLTKKIKKMRAISRLVPYKNDPRD